MIDPSVSIVGTQLSSTMLVVGGIQSLKKAPWFPLLKEGQKIVTRGASVILAAAVSVGIHYEWNPGAAGGTLILTGISTWAILHGLFHVAAQFIYQETGYQVLSGLQAMVDLAGTVKNSKPVVPAPGA